MAKMSLKALITRARTATPLPQADIAQSREAAAAELSTAGAALASAETAYRAGLVDADDDTLRALAQAQADAGLRRDRARALVERFDTQLAAIRVAEEQAKEAERQAEVERIVTEADTALAALHAAADRIVPVMIEGGQELIDLAGAAERARATAIRALQAVGDERMPAAVESFRVVAGRPEKTIDVSTVELWVDERGDPASAQEQITLRADGTGWLKLPNATYGRSFTHRRSFERREYLPALPARNAVSLARALPEIVAALGRLEMPAEIPEAERQAQVRLKPLGDAVDIRQSAAPLRKAG